MTCIHLSPCTRDEALAATCFAWFGYLLAKRKRRVGVDGPLDLGVAHLIVGACEQAQADAIRAEVEREARP